MSKFTKNLLITFICFFIIAGTFIYVPNPIESHALESGEIADFEGFTNLSIPKDTIAKVGDKVYVNLYCDNKMWEYISLYLKSTTSDSKFIVYLKDINKKPYFILPDSINPGETYELKTVYLFSYDTGYGVKVKTYDTFLNNERPFMNPGSEKYVNTVIEEDNNESVKTVNSKLETFYFSKANVDLNDNIYLLLDYTDKNNIDWISVGLKHLETGQILLRTIKDLNTSYPYLTINDGSPRGIEGEYKVTNVYLCKNNVGCKTYSSDKKIENTEYFDFGRNINITDKSKPEETKINLNNINFDNSKIAPGENMYVELDTDVELKNVLLTFIDKNNELFSTNLNNLSKNPYFTVPSTLKNTTYQLSSIIIEDVNGNSIHYLEKDNDNKHLFNKKIEIVNDEINYSNIIFNSKEFNIDIQNKIYELYDNAVITVIVDSYTYIDERIFESIKDTNRKLIIKKGETEWIFQGQDITEVKSIDVGIMYLPIDDVYSIEGFKTDSLPRDSFVLGFTTDKRLPGKCKLRFNSNLISNFKSDTMYIYHYDENADSLIEIANKIKKSNNYFEFEINNNFTYILVSEDLEIDQENIFNDLELDSNENNDNTTIENNENNNNDNNKTNIFEIILFSIMGLSIICIITITVMFIVRNKKNNS